MTTNHSTQAQAAMRRINQHINRSAGQHLRAARSGHTLTSEGTTSAQRINRAPSMTSEPLLIKPVLHRVDTASIGHRDGVAVGHCRTDATTAIAPKGCAGTGGACINHPDCADHHCQGHPDHMDAEELDVPDSERDPALTLKVLVGYAAVLLLCSWAAWQWLGL